MIGHYANQLLKQPPSLLFPERVSGKDNTRKKREPGTAKIWLVADQQRLLKAMNEGSSMTALLQMFPGREKHSINSKMYLLRKYGVKEPARQNWTDEEDHLLKKLKRQGLTNQAIGTQMGKTAHSVQARWFIINKRGKA